MASMGAANHCEEVIRQTSIKSDSDFTHETQVLDFVDSPQIASGEFFP